MSSPLAESPAGLRSRFVGVTLDLALVLVLQHLLFTVIFRAAASIGWTAALGIGSVVENPLMPCVLLCLLSSVCLSLRGRTPGMWAAGVRVASHDGGRPGTRRALVRILTCALPFSLTPALYWLGVSEGPRWTVDTLVTLLAVAGLVAARIDASRRTWWDRAAGTIALRAPLSRSRRWGLAALAVVFWGYPS